MLAVSTIALLVVLALLFAVFLPVWPFNRNQTKPPVAAALFAGAFVFVSILSALHLLGAL